LLTAAWQSQQMRANKNLLPRLRCWGLLYGLCRMLLLHLLHLDLLQLLLLHLRSGESRSCSWLLLCCYSDAIAYI
jgi:hypothetical protein